MEISWLGHSCFQLRGKHVTLITDPFSPQLAGGQATRAGASQGEFPRLGKVADADILLIPIGGRTTLNGAQAAEVISQVEPHIIIPMHYYNEAPEAPDPLDKFCREMGIEVINTQPKLTVTRNSLPAEPQVIILSQRG